MLLGLNKLKIKTGIFFSKLNNFHHYVFQNTTFACLKQMQKEVCYFLCFGNAFICLQREKVVMWHMRSSLKDK